jgi:endonuclease/exonuclease/phosphatase family metal-dependent hydrolase
VENLFDDQDDGRTGPGDRDFDPWYAGHPEVLKRKLDRLSEAVIALNDGRGPDLLAIVEVESERAADLLRQALNARLKDPELHYKSVVMKELTAGRHIAPALITRLPVVSARTQLLGRRQRILESHVSVNGYELVILASHWTSRVTDEEGDDRSKYADQLYGRFRAMYKNNPAVDVLICGDFNDTPDEDSVKDHLHAVGDRDAVLKAGDSPLLLNLLAGKDATELATHYHSGRPYIFDQLVVSPGLLDDQGWNCEVDTVQAVHDQLVDPHDRKHRRPWRFGGKNDKFERGYSDHFPVTVRLKVQGSE